MLESLCPNGFVDFDRVQIPSGTPRILRISTVVTISPRNRRMAAVEYLEAAPPFASYHGIGVVVAQTELADRPIHAMAIAPICRTLS